MLWLRTGDNAAKRLNRTQATICRTVKRVVSAFDLDLVKQQGEWKVLGNQTILNLEREVHQVYRWTKCLPLRIEAQYYCGPHYLKGLSEGLVIGNMDFANTFTPLNLLRDGLIDVWLACYPDVPESDDPDLTAFHLTRFPVRMAVSKTHPLARLGQKVDLPAVKMYPRVAMQDGAFPKIQSKLEAIGLWSTPTLDYRYDIDHWENLIDDNQTLCYVTPYNTGLFQLPIAVLPIVLPFQLGDSVIVKRSHAEHPRFRALLSALQSKAREITKVFRDVELAC